MLPDPGLIRLELYGRLATILQEEKRLQFSRLNVTRDIVRINCEQSRSASFMAPRNTFYMVDSPIVIMFNNTVSQVIESLYVGALIMLGAAIERHKEENGTILIMVSDLERSGDHLQVSIGVKFVTKTSP